MYKMLVLIPNNCIIHTHLPYPHTFWVKSSILDSTTANLLYSFSRFGMRQLHRDSWDLADLSCRYTGTDYLVKSLLLVLTASGSGTHTHLQCKVQP